jgi:hypothetical protein
MSNRDAAEKALREAGFEPTRNRDIWDRPDGVVVHFNPYGDGSDEMEVKLGQRDLPALLAPRLTEEEREALKSAVAIMGQSGALVAECDALKCLLARLGGGDVDAG